MSPSATDAVERAGSLDKAKILQALSETDLMTMNNRVKFDKNQFSGGPDIFCQWFKVDTDKLWDQKVVFSQHDFYPMQAANIPYTLQIKQVKARALHGSASPRLISSKKRTQAIVLILPQG